MAIALNHLRRHGRGLEFQTPAHIGFDGRRQVGERAHGAGELAHGDRGTGTVHTLDIAANFGVPQRQLQTECHRLGVDAMRSTDHRRPPMLDRTISDRVAQRVKVLQNQVAGFAHLQRQRCVDDIRRGQAEMEPSRRRSDLFCHRRRKGNHVVLGRLLDLLDARDIESAALANVRAASAGTMPAAAIASAAATSNEQPGLITTLIAPDSTHFRVCIARDHSKSPPRRTRRTRRYKPATIMLLLI